MRGSTDGESSRMKSGQFRIPVYRPDLSGNERSYVNDCLESSWISSKGKYVGLFEEALAKRVGASYATSVCNGTVALHLAAISLGLGPGDEVIVPSLTYVASANAIAYTGALPIFVDSRSDTWQMDPEDVLRKITARTRAIMAVHLYGHPCDMSEICRIARDRQLLLLEDCAEAFGSFYEGRHVGTFGDIGTFSFFGNKTITTGEGGAIVTNDVTLFERARHFKGQGLAAYREYWHDVIGYNYRMTNICAAIGVAQLERADEFIKRKREIAALYARYLEGLPVRMHGETRPVVHSFWMISVLLDAIADREPLRHELVKHGIETRPVFYPVHTMPMYAARYQKLPVAEDIGWRGITLPSYPGLADGDVEEICDVIRGYYSRK